LRATGTISDFVDRRPQIAYREEDMKEEAQTMSNDDIDLESVILRDVDKLSGEATIENLKQTVCREISKMDPTAEIKMTRFFNHSYGPDMVLDWSGAKKEERYLYLRTTNNSESLRDDVNSLSDFKPLMITVSPKSDPEPADTSLSDTAVSHDTFIGGLNAVHHFNNNVDANPVDGLFSKLLVKGGRGLFRTNGKVEQAVSSFQKGISAAKDGDADSMKTSLNLAEQSLQNDAFTRIDNFFQAIWKGSQHRIDTYPRDIHFSDELDDDSWNYLLSLKEIDDLDFWRSLGASLKLDQIARLDGINNPINFSHLLDAKSSLIYLKSLRTGYYNAVLDEETPSDEWIWKLCGEGKARHLALHDSNLIVYFADHSKIEEDTFPEGAKLKDRSGISLKSFKKRVHNVKVKEVKILTGVEVAISKFPDGNVDKNETFDKLANIGTVVDASIQLNSGQTANLRFDINKASAPTNSKPTISTFVSETLPVLEDLSAESQVSLKERFYVPPQEIEQLELPLGDEWQSDRI
jgi:hypothetical protein